MLTDSEIKEIKSRAKTQFNWANTTILELINSIEIKDAQIEAVCYTAGMKDKANTELGRMYRESQELLNATRTMFDLELSATQIERDGLLTENNDLKYELRKAIMYVKDVPKEILNRWVEKSKK